MAHGSIDLGYKPESILYWLRICVDSEKVTEREMPEIIKLGKIAQQKNLKPEFIYYELWGFTNLSYLTEQHISSIIQIMEHTMTTNLEPYDVFHWLRVNLEIYSYSNKEVTQLLTELLNKIIENKKPIDYLVEIQERHLQENPTDINKIASSIESTHIVGRSYKSKL